MDCWHQGLEEVNLEGWNDPLESLFFFFFYEDLGQPHKNLDPRITTFLGVMQDQELNSFQLRIFCDLVILWILKSLLSVLTGLQQHMDEDNRIEVFGSGPKFPHSPLQDCQPQPTDPGGRQAGRVGARFYSIPAPRMFLQPIPEGLIHPRVFLSWI